MPIEYSMKLEAKISPSALLSHISRTTGIPYINDELLEDESSHFTISAHQEDDRWNIELIEEDYGFTPFVRLALTKGKVEPSKNAELMLKTVAGVLKDFLPLLYEPKGVLSSMLTGESFLALKH